MQKTNEYKAIIEMEKKAKCYFRFGKIEKITALYYEIAGNMQKYQGMKEEIWKKIFKVGAMHENGKKISKDVIQKMFVELSQNLQKEKSPKSLEKRKRGGQIGNQNARKGGLIFGLRGGSGDGSL